MEPKEIIIIIVSVISTGIAVYKAMKNGTMLKAVIKGVEKSVLHVKKEDIYIVKNQIQDKAREYAVAGALHKIVKKLTKRAG